MRPIPTTLILTLLLATHLPAQTPSFTGLGDLPGGEFYSTAQGVSNGGSVVVGRSISSFGPEAFRWTREVGMQPLLNPNGARFASVASDVSADGSVILANGEQVFRWTLGSGVQGLGDWEAGDVSNDDMVIAGTIRNAEGFFEAAIWRGGQVFGLGNPPGRIANSFARGVSGDGLTVVGQYEFEAFYWTETTGIVSIGDLGDGGPAYAGAWHASADGSVIVGVSTSARADAEAWRWTSENGMHPLGDLPGGDAFSRASAVSSDGTVVVGGSSTWNATDEIFEEAFIWDEDHGMRHLQTVLETEYGLRSSGWILQHPTAISPDGTAIVGYGVNPAGHTEAWLAIIPEPTTLPTLAAASTLLTLRRRHSPKHQLSPRPSNSSQTHY